MAIEVRMEGWPTTSRPTSALQKVALQNGDLRKAGVWNVGLRSVDRLDPDEIVRWASFLSTASENEAQRGVCDTDSVRALAEVADRDEELLRRAWLVALRRLREGDTTRRAVHLTQAALEASHQIAS